MAKVTGVRMERSAVIATSFLIFPTTPRILLFAVSTTPGTGVKNLIRKVQPLGLDSMTRTKKEVRL